MPHTPETTLAIGEEQAHVDHAERRRLDLVAQLDTDLRTPVRDRTDEHRRALLLRRHRALIDGERGLVLGRLDTDDGEVHRIGRVGIPADDDGPPIVLDWRADAARPFYTATPLDRRGVARRRHIRTDGLRVVAVDDEDLTASGSSDLVGEAALLAALDERRTGRMGTAVATLQREQDAIVRADADRPLVVQGGPGTGKTVVALHRVAYLLFSHPEIARRGVLVLGPSRTFLDYVEQVLPALGETAVVSTTCADLVPGVRAERAESREIAELKGRALWWPALRRRVAGLVPEPAELTLDLDGERLTLTAARIGGVLRSALAGDRSLHAARAIAFAGLRDLLVDAVVERTTELLTSVEVGFEDILGRVDQSLSASDDRGVRTQRRSTQVDGELSDEDISDLRDRVDDDRRLAAQLERWWPIPAARAVLESTLNDAGLLAAIAPELTDTEIAAVAAEPRPLAESDIALLDALVGLLGTPDGEPSEEPPPFLAERAAADPGWTYGHVVVDEAQELSAMQWHMVRRRAPTGSVTAVGDIDQTAAPHRHHTWDEALSPALGDRWRRRSLTICYRTPREVMALVGPVLARAGSAEEVPRAVRSSGHPPRIVEADGDPAGTVTTLVAELSEAYPGGSVGVVAAAHLTALRAAVPDVPVLSPTEAKGLEWDACVVVDPDAIAEAPRGWNALYVALTRCTQELVQLVVRHGPLGPS